MKIVSDHGFPKGDMPDDDAFDRFKNERDYIKQSGKLMTTVAAMDWAANEIERLREVITDLEMKRRLDAQIHAHVGTK